VEVSQPPDYYFKAYFNRKYLAHLIHKRRIDKILSLVPEGSLVLDAGCGSGIVPFLLATKKDCTGVGIGIRDECVEFASGKTPAFNFLRGDIRDFSLAKQFDVVLCMEVLEHFEPIDQTKVISCLNGHLKHGGLLILTFPSKLYFFIEPLWKLVRKTLHRSTVFDDTDYHCPISPARMLHSLQERNYILEQSTLHSLGLISLLVVRKKSET
jgi:SAM-dependent methyltransferase